MGDVKGAKRMSVDKGILGYLNKLLAQYHTLVRAEQLYYRVHSQVLGGERGSSYWWLEIPASNRNVGRTGTEKAG
ncbi:hypothetical protein N7495_009508 [Penicillium taxi]|uniref:uncharacterized protein n=1 Tax=Penicillium taxi TaxID=168475 RepID=UPI002545A37D|nr:uncharacterized protein N7495_009508 [Penicillium taxi]KAJ5884998.1 hypothetical protein N7495_009508 [Penicillium taxi]